jgi:serine/threonine-protein kinase
MTSAAPSIVGGRLGRYELHGTLARGGMATVYIGRMLGAAGFTRTVAIKRLHPHLAADGTFRKMFADEARLAARIRHPNVVDTLDVVVDGEELLIVMDFVLGETLSKLVRVATERSVLLPPPVVAAIVIGALEGLHAAHEATNEHGEPLGIVHRDVSPQNIIVARDGTPRMLDFGVAKSTGRLQQTEGSEIKGKLAYMAPEQITRGKIDRRCDLFAMGIVLWETLTMKRLFAADDAASTLYAILNDPLRPPSELAPGLTPALDAVVLRALSRDPDARYATAQEMALALEEACLPAPARHGARWVEELAGPALRTRADMVRAVERAAGAVPQLDEEPDIASRSGAQRVSGTAISEGSRSWRHAPAEPALAAHVPPPPPSIASGPLPPLGPPHAAPTVPRHLVAIFVAGSGILAIIGVIALVLGLRTMAHRSRLKHVEPAPPPAAQTIPLPPAPAVSAAAGAAQPEPPVAAPAAPADAAPRPAAARPRASASASAKAARSAAALAAECENPFVIEPSGIKRPKPQCFGH